jgi:hypothetical protein
MKHDHWVFLAVAVLAIAIAWYMHQRDLAQDATNK